MSSSGRRGLERRPSGSAVSSVVSKFSQKPQDSYSKDRPQPKTREPLAPRDNVANRLKGPKSSDQSVLAKSKQNGSQSSVKSTESKDREKGRTSNASVQSNNSRRSSDASTGTDLRRQSSDASTGTDISIPASPNEDLSLLERKIPTPKVSGYTVKKNKW